jgi:hypothetical protein
VRRLRRTDLGDRRHGDARLEAAALILGGHRFRPKAAGTARAYRTSRPGCCEPFWLLYLVLRPGIRKDGLVQR